MKKIIFIWSILLLISCKKEPIYPRVHNLHLSNQPHSSIGISYQPPIFSSCRFSSYLKDTNELLSTVDFYFDRSGKVVKSIYTDPDDPQNSSVSFYEYDVNGRLIKEIKDNVVYMSVVWHNDGDNVIAEVFNVNGEKIYEYIYLNDLLMESRYGYHNNHIQCRKYHYDANQNIISFDNGRGGFVRFSDYDTNVFNPYSLLKSIGMLSVQARPYYKNIYRVKTISAFQGDDYYQPETSYNYHYTIDAHNRVVEKSDDLTLIYVDKFEYHSLENSRQ